VVTFIQAHDIAEKGTQSPLLQKPLSISKGGKKSLIKILQNSWGREVIKDPLERKTLGVGGVQIKMSSVGGGLGYFLEPHNAIHAGWDC